MSLSGTTTPSLTSLTSVWGSLTPGSNYTKTKVKLILTLLMKDIQLKNNKKIRRLLFPCMNVHAIFEIKVNFCLKNVTVIL